MTQQDRDGLTTRQLGAMVILNAEPAEQPALAQHMGIALLPGEDLLAGFARKHGISRFDAEVYFQAVAHGVGVEHARILAAPTAGAVQ